MRFCISAAVAKCLIDVVNLGRGRQSRHPLFDQIRPLSHKRLKTKISCRFAVARRRQMSKGGGRTNCIGGATARKKGTDKDGGRDIPSISSLAATSLPGTNNTRPLSVIGEEFLNKALGTDGRERY